MSGSAAPAAATAPTSRVWDPVVRLLHAALVVAVGCSAIGLVAWFGLHRPAGHVAAGLVLARGAWGVVGPRRARWRAFVRGPRATLVYAREAIAGRAPRYLGHNPLGAWMAIALGATVLALALTGWLYTTDAFWGDAGVEAVHRALAIGLAGLVVLHVAGAVLTGRRHRDHLLAAMVHGRKRAAGPGDVD